MEQILKEDRYSHLKTSLGSELFSSVQHSKILVVGAGGIGCELLKNLVLSGFTCIHIVDLDTIDLSNLNRQFLFQRKHIGLSKSIVAKEAAMRFNPHAQITAYHDNIKSSTFDPDFFRQFTIIMNALDNLEARRHVNRLCVATGIPLIESGTSGYMGQVQVIKKGNTECYECQPVPPPKTYAYCTIRSSPTKPIHCVIWAKEEFSTYFGDVVVSEEEEPIDDKEVLAEEKKLEAMRQKEGFAKWLFHKLFYTVIFRKIRLGIVTGTDFWPDREPPKPLSLSDALQLSQVKDINEYGASKRQQKDSFRGSFDAANTTQIFYSATNLSIRKQTRPVEFDKDDPDALDFVSSAANLRSHVFNIPLQSRFTVKSLAGSIIPAIATTNAVIAGLMVTEAFKILRGKLDDCRMVYLKQIPSNGRLLLATPLVSPNPKCYVCGFNQLFIKINTNTTKLDYFVNKVLKERLATNEPIINDAASSDCLFEMGSGLEKDEIERFNKRLSLSLTVDFIAELIPIHINQDLRMGHNSVLDIEDFSQDFKIQVSIIHCDTFPEDQTFEIIGEAELPVTAKQEEVPSKEPPLHSKQEEDDVMIIEAPQLTEKKRKRSSSEEQQQTKRAKVQQTKESKVIELD